MSFKKAFLPFILSLALLFVSVEQVFAQSPADTVRAVLSAPDSQLSYERAKLTFDRIIAPEMDEVAITAEIDQLANAATRIAAGGNDIAELQAVRQVIYEAGVWNDNRPFVYDHDDPFGQDLRNKLLTTYFETRRGNCVSMPILQLIVAERLGLNVSLSTAPAHVFMRYTNPTNGRSIAIESTSGGHPARESEYHQKMGVTEAQVTSGIYLGTLTKRESIVIMASTANEWLMEQGRYQEAIELSEVLLEHFRKDVHALLTRGTAQGQILQIEFATKYPLLAAIPPTLWPRYDQLSSGNAEAFRQAEAWGWVPTGQ